MRALAVVVVATPCPLILAAPIAYVSGLLRPPSAGVIVEGVAEIETLGLGPHGAVRQDGHPRRNPLLAYRSSEADACGPGLG